MGILNMVYGGGQSYKTYTELKAMTLADALAELNTDAQGYYDNLNGNGHIIGIGIANDDKTTYQCWDVSPIIYWNGSWRNGEIIIAKIKTDSSGNLMIPKAGYTTGGSQANSYNLWISYDGGNETQYSGAGSSSTLSITIATGLTPNSDHTIVIRPNSESYGWARFFGFYNSGVQTLLTEIIYDGSYKGYSSSSTDTGNYFKQYQYSGCTALTSALEEVIPSSVTSIGNYFRGHQYYGCTGLTKTSEEIIPSSVTSISICFREYQYSGCTSLITAQQEVLPNSVTSIGQSFRRYQYYGCTSLVKASEEVFPNSVESVSSYFRGHQYFGCTSLVRAPKETFSTLVTNVGTSFREYQYSGCTSLNEIEGWNNFNISTVSSGNIRIQQFRNIADNTIVKVFGDVGSAPTASNSLDNSKVLAVRVPTAYLNNYKDSTLNPWVNITDSKFVGY